jgi:diguanylate cyclase (GGDEF)-like protein/PAS domain S-box-containing protein
MTGTGALLDRLFAVDPGAVALVAADGRLLRANSAFGSLLGLPDATALRDVDLAGSADWPLLEAALHGTVDRPQRVALALPRHDGVGQTLPADILALDLDGQRCVLLQCSGVDALARARAERDRFFALAPDLVALLDAQGCLCEANPAWTVSLGWETRQLLGTALAALAHEDDRERLQAALRACATGADVLRARLRSRFGGWRWFEWTISAFDDGRLYATARDVTGQLRAREALMRHRDELEARIAERTAELDAALARLRLHADNSPLASIEWDAALRVSYWSHRAAGLTGWRADEVEGRTPRHAPLFDSAAAGALEARMGRLLRREAARQVHTQRVRTRDGRELVCEWFDSAVYDARGEVVSILSLVQDVTAREAAAAALADSEERFRLAFEQTAVGMAHLDLEGRWLRSNRRLAQMLGHGDGGLPAQGSLFDVVHPDDRAADAAALAALRAGEVESCRLERRLLRTGGGAFWAQQTLSLRREADGRPVHFILVVEDIDARKRAEQALQAAHEELEAKVAARTRELERLMAVLEHQARQDPLTGLPNRRGLMERLPRTLERSGRQQGGVVVMFVDLDRFKQVNDSHGHEAGDALLRECAARLVATVRKTDIVARLGGDEFVVVLENVREPAGQAHRVAEKIRHALAAPLLLGGVPLAISASIGVVVHEGGVATPEELIARADHGMYAAKRGGGNAVRLREPQAEAG